MEKFIEGIDELSEGTGYAEESEDELFEHFRFIADKGQNLIRVDKFLVEGAILECEYGGMENLLIVPDPHPHGISGRPIARKSDHEAFRNIWDFHTCEAAKRDGDGTDYRCQPLLPDRWQNPSDIPMTFMEGITLDSYLVCKAFGGLITPQTTGQGPLSMEQRMMIIWKQKRRRRLKIWQLRRDAIPVEMRVRKKWTIKAAKRQRRRSASGQRG